MQKGVASYIATDSPNTLRGHGLISCMLSDHSLPNITLCAELECVHSIAGLDPYQ